MASNGTYTLRIPALQIQQGEHRRLYSFAIEGKQLHKFATVSRIKRDDDAQLAGYQRPEVLAHIGEIRRYIESDNPMIPNALVIAFDERVHFESHRDGDSGEISQFGHLIIPVDESQDETDKPGWLVDGQQRAAAIRDARVTSFPMCVTAFITEKDSEQREQFILVNSTKPLPKGLIYELLPETEGCLPSALLRRRFPAILVSELNFRKDGALAGMIRTPTNPGGIIKDNSMLKMLENSLTDGALYHYRDPSTGGGQIDAMVQIVDEFWTAVRRVFTDAWGKKPRDSRLMHGAGVVSLGLMMDAIYYRRRNGTMLTAEEFADDLMLIKDDCRWTAGHWNLAPDDQRKWNELQNTSRDIEKLANFLLITYLRRVGRLEVLRTK